MKKYTDKDMLKIINGIEVEFQAHLAKAEEEIKKSEASNDEDNFEFDEAEKAQVDELYASMSKKEATAHYLSLKKNLFGEETETKMEKSEVLVNKELEDLKLENEELKKSVESFVELFQLVQEKTFIAPKQRAVTSFDQIEKSEEKEVRDVSTLTKSEINEKLTKKIREGKLAESDKSAISGFFNGNNGSLESIKHLL